MIIYEKTAHGREIHTDLLAPVTTHRARVQWNSFFITMQKLTPAQRKKHVTQS
jgi:hypothetical protein